jgi:hypothetical protein
MSELRVSALEMARKKRADMAEQGIKVVVLDPIEKAAKHPSSLRMAVNAMCWDCVGAGADANPRAAIRECGIKKCPMWNVRPYQVKDEPDLS